MQSETVLVTGGAGSLGCILTRKALEQSARTVRVLDTDEYGLFRLKRSLPRFGDKLRLLLGDIRDRTRVRLALRDADTVFDCAALKNVEVTEYNPIETCKTNIMGTATLVEEALESRPSKYIYISSDKSVHHSTLYGATKFCGEKMVLWANGIQEHTRFSVVRPPNYRTSRGNVFEVWNEERIRGIPLSITDLRMRRFFIETEEAADTVVHVHSIMQGGEIFVPKSRERRILDMLPEGAKTRIIGRRPGEKLREQLYTDEEALRLEEQEGLIVIRPS